MIILWHCKSSWDSSKTEYLQSIRKKKLGIYTDATQNVKTLY
uniref:Uncharacterized protein n=1 Tax=Arundo donax TaxID=35708 RepID=A0A0A9E4P6_ARUDO